MIFHVHAVRRRNDAVHLWRAVQTCAYDTNGNRNPNAYTHTHTDCTYVYFHLLLCIVLCMDISTALYMLMRKIRRSRRHRRSRDSCSLKRPTKPICSRRRRQNDSN